MKDWVNIDDAAVYATHWYVMMKKKQAWQRQTEIAFHNRKRKHCFVFIKSIVIGLHFNQTQTKWKLRQLPPRHKTRQ